MSTLVADLLLARGVPRGRGHRVRAHEPRARRHDAAARRGGRPSASSGLVSRIGRRGRETRSPRAEEVEVHVAPDDLAVRVRDRRGDHRARADRQPVDLVLGVLAFALSAAGWLREVRRMLRARRRLTRSTRGSASDDHPAGDREERHETPGTPSRGTAWGWGWGGRPGCIGRHTETPRCDDVAAPHAPLDAHLHRSNLLGSGAYPS